MAFAPPQDVVAVFHASFHPTRGNVLDWHFSADDDLDIESLGLEFSALPSGLHQLDEDVIYFTTTSKPKHTSNSPPQTYHALALFRRRRTSHPLYRGFLLGSLGILVAGPSERVVRATPWRHLTTLKVVAERCYSRPGSEPSALVDIPASEGEEWFAPAREFFEQRRDRGVSAAQEPWTNWKDELHDEVRFWLRSSACPSHPPDPPLTHITPTLALPSVLSLLGPASLTLYRHLLTRKRILIYTKPPVEFACVMCYAAVDMVRSVQQEVQEGYMDDAEDGKVTVIPSRHSPSETTRVLGMVTLHDLLGSKFGDDGDTEHSDEDGVGRGWIACTTDALFLEKPSYYDLLIDLTSVGVSSSSTVAFTTPKHPTSAGANSPTNSGSSWMITPVSGAPAANGTRPRPTMYISVPKHPLPIPAHVNSSSTSGKPKNKSSTKRSEKPYKKSAHYKRQQTRWAWSDVRLWGELDKVLRVPSTSGTPYSNGDGATNDTSSTGHGSTGAPTLPTIAGTTATHECKLCGGKVTQHVTIANVDSSSEHGTEEEPAPTPGGSVGAKPSSPGTGAGAWLADAWQLYEDVCLVCAGAWMGTLRTRNLGVGSAGEGDGYFTSGSVSGNGPSPGSNLKRTVSTPLYAGSGISPGKMEYRSITMPASVGRVVGRGHKRSLSASIAGEAGRKGLGVLVEDTQEPDQLGPTPSAPSSTGNKADTDPDREHEYTIVAPPTPDTREGLDILLNTAAFPLNATLAEAVSKTEMVLDVLDGYASWAVGVLKGRVLAGAGGAVEGNPENHDDDREIYSSDQAAEPGEARTSAIELSVTAGSSGGGSVSRRSTPPPPPHKGDRKPPPKRVKDMSLVLTPRDVLALDLNPLSASDIKYLEGLVGEYASRAQVVATSSPPTNSASFPEGGTEGLGKQPERVPDDGRTDGGSEGGGGMQVVEDIHVNFSVKRGWRDLVGVVLGLGL
ncbi:hypothetical protein FA13DRAFT_1777318 [Coprinellus micaceus]|uniref:Uncharacterized protein n=1 Tax=Coprinellus micaceus TaxID=71717 RepID=A0A4Y7SV66_COPMI|nr:hypothetical protein FA13DRAFT_1777318 [Coprinellus micaceus]